VTNVNKQTIKLSVLKIKFLRHISEPMKNYETGEYEITKIKCLIEEYMIQTFKGTKMGHIWRWCSIMKDVLK